MHLENIVETQLFKKEVTQVTAAMTLTVFTLLDIYFTVGYRPGWLIDSITILNRFLVSENINFNRLFHVEASNTTLAPTFFKSQSVLILPLLFSKLNPLRWALILHTPVGRTGDARWASVRLCIFLSTPDKATLDELKSSMVTSEWLSCITHRTAILSS